MMTNTRPVDRIFPEAKRSENISARKCVEPPFGCGKPVGPFKDKVSWMEYNISGLCQTCQDKVFG